MAPDISAGTHAQQSAAVTPLEAMRTVFDDINRYTDAGRKPPQATLRHWETLLHRALTQQPPAEAQPVAGLGAGGRYWRERAEFWRSAAVALGWREARDAANGEAPPPSAPEAQPVAHYCEHRHKCKWHADGPWPSFGTGEFRAQAWKDAHAERCGGRILPLYTAPPPSAPVRGEGDLPNRLLLEAGALCLTKGRTDQSSDVALLREAAAALAQQPAAVQDDRFQEGFADAIRYADAMEEAAAALYERVIGPDDGSNTGTDLLATVTRQLEQPAAVNGACAWHEEPDDGLWRGSCGAAWSLDDGGPADNAMRYCPSCGRQVALADQQGGQAA